MTVEVTINDKALRKALEIAPVELYRTLKDAAGRIGERYLGYHRARRMSGGKGGKKGVRGKRNGLRKHFGIRVAGRSLSTLTLWMGTKSYVAIQHEVGATVRARGHRYMVLPMQAARDQYGRRTKRADALLKRSKAMGFATTTKRQKGGMRLFPLRRSDGKTFLVTKQTGKKGYGGLTFWFHLVRSVQLRPRLGFHAEWPSYEPRAIREFNAAVGRALRIATRRSG